MAVARRSLYQDDAPRGAEQAFTAVRQRTDERPPTNMFGNLVADEKPDTMIAGREDGRPSGPGDERPDQASLPRQLSAAPINPQNPTPLNDQNDTIVRIRASLAKAR